MVTDFVDQRGDDGQGRPLQLRVKGVRVRDENWGRRGKSEFISKWGNFLFGSDKYLEWKPAKLSKSSKILPNLKKKKKDPRGSWRVWRTGE